jgi:hypothetical protein
LSETWDISVILLPFPPYIVDLTLVNVFVLTSTMKPALLFLIFVPLAFGFPWSRELSDNPPTVTLDTANVTGINENGLSKFLGIPFAQPPLVSPLFRF